MFFSPGNLNRKAIPVTAKDKCLSSQSQRWQVVFQGSQYSLCHIFVLPRTWAVREMVFAGFDGISCHGQAIKSHTCKWSKRTLQSKVPDNAYSHYRIQVFRTILISLGKVDCCSVLLTGKLHRRTKICVNISAGCTKMNITPFSEGFSKVILPQLLSNI